MTKEDSIKMALEAGFGNYTYEAQSAFEHFANLVAVAEREACAVMIENYALQYAEPVWALKITEAIRARSQS